MDEKAGPTLGLGDLATDIDPAEKAAILQAAAKWQLRRVA